VMVGWSGPRRHSRTGWRPRCQRRWRQTNPPNPALRSDGAKRTHRLFGEDAAETM
jgi:hypothetical protein